MADSERTGPDRDDGPEAGEEDVLAASHLHHSEAEQEALANPDWLPAKIPEAVGAAVVLILMVGVAVGVILRYTGHGVLGLIELASLSMLVVVVLGAAGLSYRDEHVRLEIIDSALGEKRVGRLELFVDAVQILVTVMVIYALSEVFRTDLMTGTTLSGELDIPRQWVSGVAVICFLLVLVVLIRKVVVDVRVVRKGND
ncbi:TRAP transporter small permease [Janibacter corallicola]|uniref:TRAP transporter small permease n=1 Tax=Janibacter corallicola TaxID=415212 RepID=UPI000832E1C4|nr:TRAP transporter small permease [Janibacter corallicola]